MKAKKWTSGLIVLFLITALTLPSLAAKRGPQPKQAQAVKKIVTELELTEVQKELFKQHREDMKKETEAHRDKVKKLAESMKEEMAKDEPSQLVIHQTIRQINALNTDMQIKRVDSLLKLRQNLTPEQRQKFKKMLEHQSTMNPRYNPWSDLSDYDILGG